MLHPCLEAGALCDLEEDRGRVAEVVSSELRDQGLGQQLHDYSARPPLAVDLGATAGRPHGGHGGLDGVGDLKVGVAHLLTPLDLSAPDVQPLEPEAAGSRSRQIYLV